MKRNSNHRGSISSQFAITMSLLAKASSAAYYEDKLKKTTRTLAQVQNEKRRLQALLDGMDSDYPRAMKVKVLTIQYLIDQGRLSPDKDHRGNYDWWALIQVWAQQGHKDYLDIPDMGYGVDADETVSPKSLTELDKKWVTRTFGDIYNDKDRRVIITRHQRNHDEEKSYLSLPDDNKLARLCDKIVDFLNKHIDFSS